MKDRQEKEAGVISLEACIVVPVFMFLMLFMYGLILIFMGQQAISHALLQSAESLSLDPFATERLEVGDIEDGAELLTALYEGMLTAGDTSFSSTVKWYSDASSDMPEIIKKRFLGYLAGSEESADNVLKAVGIVDGKAGIDFSGSTVSGNVLNINLKYKQKFLFDANGLGVMNREIKVSVKLWGVSD
ncbi:MAG: hypothetical protein ACI4AD_04245 [Roseburia sp.]